MRHLTVVSLPVVGMLSGSLLPVVVSGARTDLGFTIGQSASLGSAAILWAAVGALAIALVGVPTRWKLAAALGLAGMIALDLGSTIVREFFPLLTIRAADGFTGGIVAGIGYARVGRAPGPDRLFAAMLAAQFLTGGAGTALLPSLIAAHGIWVLFVVLAGASLVGLGLVPLMPELPIVTCSTASEPSGRLPTKPLLVGLTALLLFEAGHTAGSAFILGLGQAHAIPLRVVQSVVGLGGMGGMIGALAAFVQGTRFGRRGPVLYATAAGLAASGLVLIASPVALAAGSLIGSIAWAYSIPLVLGGCTAVAPGRAIWLSFTAKVGLAAGPLVAALVVSPGKFGPSVLLSALLGVAGALLFFGLQGTVSKPAL